MDLHRVWIFCLLVPLVPEVRTEAGEIIRTAADLRAMPPAEAAKAHPVDMEVVATFVDRSRGMLFVNDGSNGFYVKAHELIVESDWLSAARKLRLLGVTHEGEFLPVVAATEFIDLGPGNLPQAAPQKPIESILAPLMDSQWVEVEGVVKRVGRENAGLTLYLEEGTTRLPLELPRSVNEKSSSIIPFHLLERRVKLRAVSATLFNEQRQMSGRVLYLPSLNFLTLLDGEEAVENLPLRRMDELLLPSSPLHELVRVQGIVTHAVPESMLFLRGDGGSIRIDSALTPALAPGTLIEAAGTVTFSPFRPSMNASSIKTLATGEEPAAIPLDDLAERRSIEQFELVTLDTLLVETISTSTGARLLCRSPGAVFEAKLSEELARDLKLVPGMRLRLRGICELEIDNPFGIARVTKVFTIALRNPRDLVILEQPPYWNNRRLLMLLAVTGAIGLIFATSNWFLRRMVAEKSIVIERQTAARATLDERQRIARDLHDTLEQELSGVSMLLETTARQLDTQDREADRTLSLARRLLRHSREESRSTIRDLRSVMIERMGLIGAMEEMLRPLAESAGLSFELATEGTITPLPGTVEAAFLRIAHEAVSNAAKHSGGTHIKMQMTYAPQQVRLDVHDDGAGFSPETAADESTGHFGLMGMRERALRIGARLLMNENAPRGTLLSLIWDAAPPAKS